MRVRYVVEVDFHPATPALRRVGRLFADLADVAGVRSVDHEVIAEVEETEAERQVD